MPTPAPTPSFNIPMLAASFLQASSDRQTIGKSKATRKTSVDLTLDDGEHVRLHDIFDPPLHATEMPPIKIKWQNKIQAVAVMTWRLFEVEPALLAFVQHFEFNWEDGWILLGRNSAEEGFAHIWYKVVKLPVQTKIRFAQDADKVPFAGSRDNFLEYHASFIGLLGESQMPNDRHTYIMEIYWILELFPSMQLPFLPNSAWMRDGTIRPAKDASGDINHSETLEEKERQSLDNAGARPSTPKRSKQIGGSTPRQTSSSIHRSSHKRRASGSAEGTPTKKSQV